MNFWVAGADWDGEDQTEKFIEKSIWQNGYNDKYLDRVKKIKAGDRIAIKAIYGQKHQIPFNNYNCLVSCMKIKAIGTVRRNLNDGRTLEVNWEQQFDPEEVIYLYTYRQTISRIKRKDVQEYIFNGKDQNFSELEKFYKKRSEQRQEILTDEFILRQFRPAQNFHYIEQNAEQRALFLQLARYIHNSPMDWWLITSEKLQVRFGINNKYNGRNSTVSYVAAVGFDQEGTYYLPNENESEFSIDEEGLVRLTAAKLEELKNMSFSKMDINRDPFVGYWPENYKDMEDIEEEVHKLDTLQNYLNRILFGAAGTGKTYHTINHALSIIENKPLEVLEQEGRTALKVRFDQYKEQGQIKFVTFHQSFSYEDFVEGIRAKTDNGQDSLTYSIVPGVFKQICDQITGLSQQVESIDSVVENFLEEITEKPLELSTQQNKKFVVSVVGSGLTLQCQPLASETNATYYANISKIKGLLSGEILDKVYNRSYIKAVAEYLKPQITTSRKSNKNQNYVMIIDEINRGNISRIFGELITLIEDSKRAGAAEELSVTLPYSKKEFTVPKNLYILGTMNSSDRSLTGLDIALRRRFTFIEMPPRPELLKDMNVEGVNIGTLLKVINQRIEVLLDRDHCIGHANFMTLTTESTVGELAQIFKQKIIPQLQEYFFDDWSKINMVLNANGMLQAKTVQRLVLFPNVDTETEGFFEEQKTWHLNDTAFDSIASFSKIIKH